MIFLSKNSSASQPTALLVLLLALSVILSILQNPVATASSLETSKAKKDSLQLVQVIFRHGDRAPTYTYPNDPYHDISIYWPEGLAQLTNRGKMQQYELGQYLRHRYDGYLGEKYDSKELYVTSSDMDRTIMSLESNLAGLFPPVNRWNPKIEWQPIPLRTIPWKDDKILHNNVKCPRYLELRREFLESSEVVRKMNEENAEFIQYCVQHSGLTAKSVKDLYPLLDVLYAQSEHNLSLPEWVRGGEVLPKLLQLYSTVNTWPTYTVEMKRLWGGPLLNLLIKNMQAIVGHLGANPEDAHSVSRGVNRKMLMYSAHDSTLARIMNTMGVFQPHCPPYASALLVELHQDSQTFEYYVELHYRNDTRRDPHLLMPVKCGHPCKLGTFMEINQPLIPLDWDKECGIDTSSRAFNLLTSRMHEYDDSHDEEDEFYENVTRERNNFQFNWSSPTPQAPMTSPSHENEKHQQFRIQSWHTSPLRLVLILLGMGFGIVLLALVLTFLKVVLLQRGGYVNFANDNFGREAETRESEYRDVQVRDLGTKPEISSSNSYFTQLLGIWHTRAQMSSGFGISGYQRI